MAVGRAFPGAGRGRRGRSARLTILAAVLVAGLAACSPHSGTSSTTGGGGNASTGSVSSGGGGSSPTVQVDGSGDAVSFLDPVRLVVRDGSFTAVQVSTQAGDQLDGTVSADGTSWVSQSPPRPGASYQAVATIKDTGGQTQTRNVDFSVATVPQDQRLTFTVTPNDGATVGIGQPVVVRFLSPVTERAAIEKVMLVDAKTAAGQPVSGSWHWLNSQEVHWRPQVFWTPGTTVRLDMKIAGVKAAKSRFGRKDYSQTFRIGASHITRYDASTRVMRVYRDGALVASYPSGSGRRGLETYSGTYIVLGKSAIEVMDSCSAKITCDKKNPDYYNDKEYWATRITRSGTFVHAADWDPLIGKANVSHGCIHLRGTDAHDFYNHAVVGDVVIVSKTGRGPQERINTQDPGLYDWNLTWAQWTAGSALGGA